MKHLAYTSLLTLLIGMTIFLLPSSLEAQGSLSLSDAISQSQVEVSIKGRSSTYFQPMVVLEIRNLSPHSLTIDFPLGSILKSQQESACDLLFLRSDPSPIFLEVSPADSPPTVYRLFAYCLELAGLKQPRNFPSVETTYQPTGELASEKIQKVLANIAQENAAESFPAQIAIWMVATGQTLEQVAAAMQADYKLYEGQVNQFLGAQTPPSNPEATPISETPGTNETPGTSETPSTNEETASPEEQATAGLTDNPIILFAGVLGFIVLIAMVLFAWMLRGNHPPKPLPPKKIEPPPPPPPWMQCIVCGSPINANRECSNPDCPTHLPRKASYSQNDPTSTKPIPRQNNSASQSVATEDRKIHPDTDPIRKDHLDTESLHRKRKADYQDIEATGAIGRQTSYEPQNLTLELEITAGSEKPANYKIEGSSIGLQGMISRGEPVQIELPNDTTVSMPHAMLDISRDGSKDRIRDLGSRNGTFVNGKKLTDKKWHSLNDRDRLQFGNTVLIYNQADRELLYEHGSNLPLSLSGTNRWLISRYKIANLIDLDSKDTTISVPHVYIRYNKGLLDVRDLSSMNGVQIQNKPIHDKVSIFNGDVIQIGRETKIKVVTNIIGIPEEINHKWRRSSLIARGGMADVYHVQNRSEGQRGALKVPRPDMYRLKDEWGERHRELFPQECRLTSQLKHTNLVEVLDSGEIEEVNLPYLVLAYVDGPSVQAIIEKLGQDAFSVPNAVQVIIQVCEALKVIHEHRYIHCDIKPSNILIDKKGQVYLIDLGIATPLEQKFSQFGHTNYLPKEIWKDEEPVTFETDIYSLGQTLFEMLVARSLSTKDEVSEAQPKETTAVNRTAQERPATILRQKVSSSHLQEIITKCRSENRKERYQRVEYLMEALSTYGEGADLAELVRRTGWR